MINIKKIIFCLFVSLLFFTKAYGVIEDALFITVGNKPITKSDVVNEIKKILILNNQNFTEDKKTQLQEIAIKSIIKRSIKEIEIEKYESLQYKPVDLNIEIEKITTDLNIDLDTLKNIFLNNGIDFADILDQMRTELLWNTLIFQLYKDRVSINVEEIGEQLKLLQNKKEVQEFLISEIIVRSVPSESLEAEIQRINDLIKKDGFEKVAMDLSVAETAIRGGDLGWINENVISDEFKSKITTTPVGSVSDPILLKEGILFFKIRDKREIKEFSSLEEAKNELVKAEKNKILSMHALSHYDSLRRSISINYY